MNQHMKEHLSVALELQRAAYAAEPFPSLSVRRDRLQRVQRVTE